MSEAKRQPDPRTGWNTFGVKAWLEKSRETFEKHVDTLVAPGNDPTLSFADTHKVVRVGGIVVLVFVVGFLGWAAVAPLDSSLQAGGVIVVASHRKTIQHLEGGIVRSILVADGQRVRPGQPLIEMDVTQAQASLDMLDSEGASLEAQEARLLAERDSAPNITLPPDLVARKSDPKIAQILQGEENAFQTRREDLAQQTSILQQRIDENGRVIAGYQKEQGALETQIQLIQQETDAVQTLVTKGLEPVPRLLALQRQTADLSGQRGELIEKIAQVRLNTGETQLQMVNLKNQHLDDVLKDLRDVQSKRYDLTARLRAARDILNRTTLVAPVAGTVTELAVHTKGAVIRPGDTVMEIVPDNDQLEIEAHVSPEDADDVYVGMTAKISMGAYKQRRLPMMTGIVTNVSADRITDQRTGQAYFNALISVDRAMLKEYPDARIIPGMPVEVALETGSRTALSYFIEPVSDVIRKGMREK
ncbi:MAG TPA: HlyD family type I secretion periplasmic adaptor subunit [Rhizomicrobium sp.]|nr:HlyD family type I secretion periplasmic adaptor subunit [Rhizomicrobium sp.]